MPLRAGITQTSGQRKTPDFSGVFLEMRPTGVEPARVASLEPEPTNKLQKSCQNEAVSSAVGGILGGGDPDLLHLAAKWANLPAAIKAAVMAMVKTWGLGSKLRAETGSREAVYAAAG
jgi:hypothetical protein